METGRAGANGEGAFVICEADFSASPGERAALRGFLLREFHFRDVRRGRGIEFGEP